MDWKYRKVMDTWHDFRNQSCDCGGDCCSVNESVEDKNRAKKKLQSLMKHEGGFRDKMFKLEQAFLADARPENRQLAKDLKKSERGEYEITDLNRKYLEQKNLNVVYLDKDYSWLDTGTHVTLLEASNFVKDNGIKLK